MEKPRLIGEIWMQKPTEKSRDRKQYGKFKCPIPGCEKTYIAMVSNINRGLSRSCGCWRSIASSKTHKTHGMRHTRLYREWVKMRERCYKEYSPDYKNYGNIGITVCDEWKDKFEPFRDFALNNGYSDSLSIDRIDVKKGYYPENIRWVSREVQAQNTRLLMSTNTSGFRGVSYNKRKKKWMSCIQHGMVKHHLGYYSDKNKAAQAYNNFVIENKTHHPLNIIPDNQ